MSTRLFVFVALGLLLGSFGFSAPATAKERLLIPFTCELEAGGIYARPSQDQSYTIIGGRETAPYTACASDNPNRCRTMMLHRFEIDCDGKRVSWPKFYAAIAEVTTTRAYMENNRLLVRVRPQPSQLRRRSRFAPPRSRGSFLVEMPQGFAPVRGTVARFDGGRETPVAAPPPRKAPTARTTPTPTDPKPIARIKRQPQADVRRNVIEVPQPKSSAAQPLPKTNTETETKAVAKDTVRPATTSAAQVKTNVPKSQITTHLREVKPPTATPPKEIAAKPKAKETMPTIIPKMLNGARANKNAPVKLTATDTNKKDKARTAVASETPQRSMEELLQDRAEQLREATTGAISGTIQPNQQTKRLPAEAPSLANTLAVLATVATLMFGLIFAAYRLLTPKRATPKIRKKDYLLLEKTQPAQQQEIDLSIMSQSTVTKSVAKTEDKKTTPPAEIKKKNADQPAPTLAVPADHAPEPVTPKLSMAPQTKTQETNKEELDVQIDAVPDPQLPMPKDIAQKIRASHPGGSELLLPKTRQEALTALGIGATASEDVIERVVAGLRQCWRPDDAQDAADRKRRLKRMKQIETAWRILSDKSEQPELQSEQQPH